jgi:LPS sulfotransferase NodH
VSPLGLLDRVRPWQVFDRPVFVVAAPRSGSTLLFDMLEAHPDLVSWPFEAHEAFTRAQPADHPWSTGHRWPVELGDDPARRKALSRELYLGRLRARARRELPVGRLERLAPRKVRLLEKTPASVVRFGALARLYPDARFVYLHRDAPASMGSLIEAWETPSQAHARVQVDGRTVEWMMLTAPGWLELVDEPVAVKAAFQWRIGTEWMLRDLAQSPSAHLIRLSYEELVADPEKQLRRVLEHCELELSPAVLDKAAVIGSTGRTSLSSPRPDKWRARAEEIEPLLPALADLRRELGYDA